MSTAFNSSVISVITITLESFLCINMELLTRSCPHPKPHLLVYRRDERRAHKWGLHGVRVLSCSIHIWNWTNRDTTNSTYTLAWKRFASVFHFQFYISALLSFFFGSDNVRIIFWMIVYCFLFICCCFFSLPLGCFKSDIYIYIILLLIKTNLLKNHCIIVITAMATHFFLFFFFFFS